MFQILFFAFVLSQCALGQDVQSGSCGADIVGIPDFNINDFAGTWYQIQRIDNDFEGACISTQYVPSSDGSMALNITQIIYAQVANILGSAVLDTSDGSGRLYHTFQFPVGESFEEVSEHEYVVALDPSSYALVMGCYESAGNSRNVFGWKLSRTKSLTPQAISAIDDIVATSPYLSSVTWKETEQSVGTCGISITDGI